MNESTPIRLLGISGSLRRASNSTAILRTLKERIAGQAEIELFDLRHIPLYDQDLDGDTKPEPVQALRDAIVAAHGLVVVSPEYNYGISGVLKNAMDWASRPAYKSPLKDKPVVFLASSPGSAGGARAQLQLVQLFSATLSRVVLVPQVTIPGVGSKIVDGRLTDEASLTIALGAVQALLAEVRRGA